MLPTTTSPLLRPWRTLKVERALALQLVSIVLEGALDAERGAHGPLRMVLVGDRRAEERHDAVTEELVHRALVPVDLGQHELERVRHERVHVLGVEPGESAVKPETSTKRTVTCLRSPSRAALRGEDALGEVLRGVGRRAREVRRPGGAVSEGCPQ